MKSEEILFYVFLLAKSTSHCRAATFWYMPQHILSWNVRHVSDALDSCG